MAFIATLARDRLPDWPALLLGYALATVLIGYALPWCERRRPGNRAVSLIRFAGPLLVLPFVYAAAARTVLVLHGRYLDEAVTTWETALFGTSPNAAVAALATPPLTEVLMLCYFSFYGCFLLPFILRGQGRAALAERYLFAALLTLLTCYLGFIAVPLAGPALEQPPGYLIAAVQDHIMRTLDPPGTCFPSPHVAGAWITLLCLRRSLSVPARRVLWTLTSGLTVAVVYAGYHYVVDVVAGLAVALAVHAVTKRYAERPARPRIPL
ncbi:phosphatase PAP2 family protein [Nonomuraea purpurea]|uniref:Phosphatase PAP2 family protein n=1 Tax=Nonomuraea purpurea TaxID=1849276 RepID=A0ABV8GLE2_9ACTN